MRTTTLTNKELSVINQITLDNYENYELFWLYKLLIAQNEKNEEIIKISKQQQKDINKTHIFDVLNTQGISHSEIALVWKIIAERLVDLNPALENRILFDKQIVNIDIDRDNGEYCVYNPNNEKFIYNIEPIYILKLDFFKKNNDKKFIIGAKNDIEELEIRRKRHFEKDNSSLNFTFLDIVKDAISQNTSDLHINFSREYTVHFRIDGILFEQKKYTMDRERYNILLDEIAQKASADTGIGFNPNDRNMPQQGKIDYPDLMLRLRVQFSPKGVMDGNNKVVCRLIKLGVGVGTIDDLKGYDDNFIKMLWRTTQLTTGLILVAGVTNSGKSFLVSHTLMSMPKHKSIMTFEDPIEYEKARSDLTQHQTFSIESDGKVVAKVGFLELIKLAKRSDPDITEIGEMREDQELVDSIVSSVKAGNLAISTVHINSVYDVPNALVTTFNMDKNVISDILRLLINQILVPKLCDDCKIEDTQHQNAKILEDFYKNGDVRYKWVKELEDFIKEKPLTYIKNPNGCRECGYKGTKGLIPIYEFLKFDIEASEYFSKDFLSKSRFEIEEYFCKRAYEEGKSQLATNKLSTYIKALKKGVVDTEDNTVTKILL